MTEVTPQYEQPAPSQATSFDDGCLTIVVLGAVLVAVRVAGTVWLQTILGELSELVFGSMLTADLVRPLLFGLSLIIVFGLVAALLKTPRFALWRGVALSLALLGGYALIAGLMLSAERSLEWPGLPDTLRALVVLIYALGIAVANRQFFLSTSPGWRTLWGIGLGLIASIAWAAAGTLGMPSEIALSMLEALAHGLLSAELLTLAFRFDETMPAHRPFWAMLLIGMLFAACVPILLAPRGWWLQGTTLSWALLPVGFMAGLLFTLSDQADPRRLWWAVFAFFFVAFAMPFTFTEGFEGDYMLDDLALAWAPASAVQIGITSLLALIMLVARPWLARISRQRVVPIAAALTALIILLAVYFGVGRPGMQPETFFVVMADQADTSFAQEIADRDERVQAVYDALTDHANTSQADLRAFLDKRGVDYRTFYLVNGIEVRGTPWLRAQLVGRSDVAYVLNSPHARILPRYVPNNPFAPEMLSQSDPISTGVDAVDAELVWEDYGITGEGVIVGIADTGVDWHHPALEAQYLGGEGEHDYTWFDPWVDTPEPLDQHGHGTHALGSVLGADGIGVAPGARWIACRNLERNLSNPAHYLDCMQFLFAPFPHGSDPFADGDPTRGAHLTNNSWGCPPVEGCDATTLSIAVEHLRNAGQMFVVSAGNDGPDCDTVSPPANADGAFSVGAINPITGEIAAFSSRGPINIDESGRIKPDVVAPGVAIVSSVPGGFSAYDGTSMAGPHVAGVVALVWSANPALIGNIDATEEVIETTAEFGEAEAGCGGDHPNNVYGYGKINALKAVEEALNRE